MENSTKYFCNRACDYYPCHEQNGMESGFNCMFCYCPMYFLERCLGRPGYVHTRDGRKIKDCFGCTFPHQPENYDHIMEFLQNYGQEQTVSTKSITEGKIGHLDRK